MLVYDSRHFAEAAILLEVVAEQSVVSLAALLVLFVGFVVGMRPSARVVCHSKAAVLENKRGHREAVAAVATCSDPWSCHSILGGDSVVEVDAAFGSCCPVLDCSCFQTNSVIVLKRSEILLHSGKILLLDCTRDTYCTRIK